MALSDVFQSIQKKLRFTKIVEIEGIKFELGLLTFEEELKSEALPQDDIEPLVYYNQSRLQTLSYSVKSVNGEAIPAVVEIVSGDKTEKKQGSIYIKELLSSLPIKIIEQLFDAYIDLKDEAEGTIDKSMKYNWFKTPEQRAEEAKKESKQENKSEEDKKDEEEVPDIVLREIPKPPEDEKPE